jgi:phosphatidate phosphatase LPIN
LTFDELFQQSLVPHERFLEEIFTITQNPNLVVKINHRYMNWTSAAPIILYAVAYQRFPSNETINSLMTKSSEQQPQKQQPQQPQQQQTKSSSRLGWFSSWGSKSTATTTAAAAAPSSSKSSTKIDNLTNKTTQAAGAQAATDVKSSQQRQRVGSADFLNEPAGEFESENYYQRPFTSTNTTSTHHHHHHHHHHHSKQAKEEIRRTTRLSSDMIKKLNLQPGPNEIQFSVTTALQGTTRISSHIFLWSHDDKIIISDIDGTITISDVGGQVLPLFGKDWSQPGVAECFSAIEKNGYKFIYLSARAIGQSEITRNLLDNICSKNDKFLPFGPLLITPTSLFTAFYKEVIEKVPEEFKINCLKDIKSLFPSEHQPFHAGYGNRITDVKSYSAVGIPKSRIFTINPQGEVKSEMSRTFLSSYLYQLDYVDQLFPPVISGLNKLPSTTSSSAITLLTLSTQSSLPSSTITTNNDFDTFNYWRSDNILAEDKQLLEEIDRELKEAASLQAAASLAASKKIATSKETLAKTTGKTTNK